MKIENVLKLQKRMKERHKKFKKNLAYILSCFGLEKKEAELYRILLRKKLKTKELTKTLKLSERTVRRYIKSMLNKGFIGRKVIEGRRLAYEYLSIPPTDVWKNIKAEIETNIKFIDQNLGVLKNKEMKKILK